MNSAKGPGELGFDPQRLIATHQASVWRYLRALGCDPAEADDLTQETFLRILQQPFAEVHPAATAAYLRKTAFHLLVSARRREGRITQSNDIDNLEDAWVQWSQDGESDSLVQDLRRCLEGLTPKAARALELRYRENLSRADIAEKLSMSEDGAKNLLQRAKHQLRSCIEAKRT